MTMQIPKALLTRTDWTKNDLESYKIYKRNIAAELNKSDSRIEWIFRTRLPYQTYSTYPGCDDWDLFEWYWTADPVPGKVLDKIILELEQSGYNVEKTRSRLKVYLPEGQTKVESDRRKTPFKSAKRKRDDFQRNKEKIKQEIITRLGADIENESFNSIKWINICNVAKEVLDELVEAVNQHSKIFIAKVGDVTRMSEQEAYIKPRYYIVIRNRVEGKVNKVVDAFKRNLYINCLVVDYQK
jgi:hypothetical protein